MQKQLTHIEFKKMQKNNSNNIIFVLDNLEHYENIGSAFRIADAFNIDKIFIVAKDELNWRKIEKTARKCEKNINYELFNSVEDVLSKLNGIGYTPINIEITTNSKPLRDVDFSCFQKVVIIVGNERTGVSDEFLQKVPLSYHIEMYGNNSSR